MKTLELKVNDPFKLRYTSKELEIALREAGISEEALPEALRALQRGLRRAAVYAGQLAEGIDEKENEPILRIPVAAMGEQQLSVKLKLTAAGVGRFTQRWLAKHLYKRQERG